MFGYIYVIRLMDSSYFFSAPKIKGCSYKIGKTKDRPSRLKALGILMPRPSELIVSIPADLPWGERYIHEKLSDVRLNGEWFALRRHHVLWLTAIGSPHATGLSEDGRRELDNLFDYYAEYCSRDPE